MVSILNQKQKNSNQVTRQDLIELYKSRYVNEKGIKKYAKIDEQKLSHIFGLIGRNTADLTKRTAHSK